jgi:FixJ family two-component response regulator
MTTSLGYAVEASVASRFLASSFSPNDCLVADVQMPEMTGVELHRHIVNAGYAIPTILMTAYPDDAIRTRALKNGVVCYLNKPVDDECFKQCLRSALKLDLPPEGDS